jgi:carbamoyl-phosphate synthase/aspartate carbamoyltransferase/dihydroorotase
MMQELDIIPASIVAKQVPPAQLPPHNLQSQHILSVRIFGKEQLNRIFDLAQNFRHAVYKECPLDHILKVMCHKI